MFNRIIRSSVEHRYLVLFLTVLIFISGLISYRHLIIDAVPDITNIQVQINTSAEGYSPFEVEQRVTQPIEVMIAGLPGLEYTRSISRYGLSQVTVVFKDQTDVYFARQLVSQRLQESASRLPAGVSPSMGPIATGLGEIFMFIVENSPDANPRHSLQELREVQDWVVKPQLRTVPGVVEINSIGGASKQIVVSPSGDRLRSFGLTLDDLSRAIAMNNSNVGGGFIEQNGEQFLIRVPAQIESPKELEGFVVGVHEGQPIHVSDVAQVSIGSELRAGAATENGREVVLGTVFMLMGENGRTVAERVSKKLEEIAHSVPAGIVVKPVYNRARLVNDAISTVRKNLFEGALLVVAVLFVALGNLRAALITACVIPLSMVVTILGMVQGKLSANLMSLGALDFGLIVDGAVILVENCTKRMSHLQSALGRLLTKRERLELVHDAAVEVRQATMFGELIIMVVYIPILALSGIEGKMFHPMAITVLLALGAAFVFSLTFVPAAVAIFMTGRVSEDGAVIRGIQRFYAQLIHAALRARKAIFVVTALLFFGSLFLAGRLGAEFIPSLDEGDVALHALRVPGTSLEQAIEMQHHLERVIEDIPEVKEVFAKIGTAEIATDPMPPSVADGYVILKSRANWPNPGKSKQEVVAAIEQAVTKIPGNNYEFTQPIQMRFNELVAGVRSDVAIKIFGDDTDILIEQARKVEKVVAGIHGASDMKVEQTAGLPIITVRPDREATARLGLNADDIQRVVRTAYAGDEVSMYFDGGRSFPIVVRLADSERHNLEAIKDLPIALPSEVARSSAESAAQNIAIEARYAGLKAEPLVRAFVSLGQVAKVTIDEGPNQISHENGKRRVVVTLNVRGRDLGSFVSEAQLRLSEELRLPNGYWLGWGGQYENLISAKKRLFLVVPAVLLGVFGLIYLTFRSLGYSLLVYSGVPFALSGGIVALWLRGIPFSISAAVGFIALSGVSVLNGLVLVSFTRKLVSESAGSSRAISEAVINGAIGRVRPVLMTALVASLGFIPMAISQGTGSEVQRPLATVVIGGIISSTALTLLLLPILLAHFAPRLSAKRVTE